MDFWPRARRRRFRLHLPADRRHELLYFGALLASLLLLPLLLASTERAPSVPAAPAAVAAPLPAPVAVPAATAPAVRPVAEAVGALRVEDAVPPPPAAPLVHTIQPGETLFGIALRYGVPVTAIVAVNEILDPQRVHPGFVLRIPQAAEEAAQLPAGGGRNPYGQVYVVGPGESLADVAARLDLAAAALVLYNELPLRPQVLDRRTLALPVPPGPPPALQPQRAQLLQVPPADPGGVYTVRAGDSLGLIATAHNVSVDELRAANGLPGERIYTGQKLTIPDFDDDALLALSPFQWPVGNRSPVQWYWWAHQAIDLLLPVGSPVTVAAGGTVEVAGWHNHGYGYYVVVDHGHGIKTLYAHLSDFAVAPGQLVARGELIAFSGHTGYSTHPHLHFEIIANQRLLNPCIYLEGGCG